MDKQDQKILNYMQKGLDITENPFHKMSQEIGIETEEIVERLKRIRKEGYIRRIGAVFNTSKMGYKSILIAMEVSEDKIQRAVEIINSNDGVTHNYHRNNRLNVWFTLSTRSEEERQEILQRIMKEAGVDKIYRFPALKKFKINVFFDMEKI